jgi:hypothetical protein
VVSSLAIVFRLWHHGGYRFQIRVFSVSQAGLVKAEAHADFLVQ